MVEKIKPKLQLSGQDGNAFFILGRANRELVKAGYSKEEQDKFYEDATSGDYDHLLQIVMAWFDVE